MNPFYKAGVKIIIEVVFDDSSKGSMKMAKAEDADGSSQDVVCIGFALDIGDINCDIGSEQHKNKFTNMLFGQITLEESETERYFNAQREDYERLLDTAKNAVHIRAWKCNTPYSACGFAFLCDVLRDTDCQISVVELPEYYKAPDNKLRSCTCWSEIPADQIYQFLHLEHKISTAEKHVQSNIWNNLKAENALLRALVNGKLISVPDYFYDHIIIENIPDGEFVLSRLIGNILGKYPLGVSDWWYYTRIYKMIVENKLVIVGDKDMARPYGKIVIKGEA